MQAKLSFRVSVKVVTRVLCSACYRTSTWTSCHSSARERAGGATRHILTIASAAESGGRWQPRAYIHLPLGRPIASIHRHLQLASSEPREVYHYQVSTAGLQRGQKMLLGSLSHDAGQPALLISYSSATAGSQEVHWALPVECGTEICSYQRLIVDSGLDSL